MKSRLWKWRSGDIAGLWSDLQADEDKRVRSNRRHKQQHRDTVRAANVRRAKRAVQAGQYRKGIQALSSEGLALPTDAILEEMQSKHPQAPLPSTPSLLAPPAVRMSEALVARALRSFPSDSAPGPSSFRANHLPFVHLTTLDNGLSRLSLPL